MSDLVLISSAAKKKSSCLFTDHLRHCRQIGSGIKNRFQNEVKFDC